MNKKIVGFVAALTCAACVIPYCTTAVAETEDNESSTTVETVWEGQEAIFLQSVTLNKESDAYTFTFLFDKDVSEEDATIDDAKKALFAINGTALTKITGATVAYNEDDTKAIDVSVPAAFFKDGETVTTSVLGGLISATDRVTTVRYTHEFSPSATTGKRIYRSADVSAYDEVHITSISAPSMESSNFTFKIYFSDSLTSKKYIDLQAMDSSWQKRTYGENATNNKTSYSYTNAELDLLYSYQVYGWGNEHSLSNKLMFGCTEMNGLKAFFANTTGLDMTPQTTINGIQAFTSRQLQESVAQEGIYYSRDGETYRTFNGSTQVLSVQIHIETNFIQLVLKGDSLNDKDLKPVKVRREDGKGGYETQDITSFHENLAPSMKQNMLFGVKAGLIFPNGKAVHKDSYFFYDYAKKAWISSDQISDAQPNVDETLGNQMGLTEGELITYNKQK